MVSVYSNLQLGYLAICAYSVVEWNMRLHLLYLLCKFSCKKSTKRQNGHDREIGTSISKTPQPEKKTSPEKISLQWLLNFFGLLSDQKMRQDLLCFLSKLAWKNTTHWQSSLDWKMSVFHKQNVKYTNTTFAFLSLYTYCRNSFLT